jgi:hypothetical protein
MYAVLYGDSVVLMILSAVSIMCLVMLAIAQK